MLKIVLPRGIGQAYFAIPDTESIYYVMIYRHASGIDIALLGAGHGSGMAYARMQLTPADVRFERSATSCQRETWLEAMKENHGLYGQLTPSNRCSP